MNEQLTNRRRLALQLLDAEARETIVLALRTLDQALERDLQAEPRRRALARLRGAVSFDAGAWVARVFARRQRAALWLLEAFDCSSNMNKHPKG